MDWDPGRAHSVPWQWGTTAISVNTAVYKGDINTSAVWLEVPDELKGKVNVVPEMNDVVALATMYVGGEPCSEDLEVLKKARDLLIAAKPDWISMDYGATEKLSNNDWAASVNWSGSSMRARLANPDVAYGYPRRGSSPSWIPWRSCATRGTWKRPTASSTSSSSPRMPP